MEEVAFTRLTPSNTGITVLADKEDFSQHQRDKYKYQIQTVPTEKEAEEGKQTENILLQNTYIAAFLTANREWDYSYKVNPEQSVEDGKKAYYEAFTKALDATNEKHNAEDFLTRRYYLEARIWQQGILPYSVEKRGIEDKENCKEFTIDTSCMFCATLKGDYAQKDSHSLFFVPYDGIERRRVKDITELTTGDNLKQQKWQLAEVSLNKPGNGNINVPFEIITSNRQVEDNPYVLAMTFVNRIAEYNGKALSKKAEDEVTKGLNAAIRTNYEHRLGNRGKGSEEAKMLAAENKKFVQDIVENGNLNDAGLRIVEKLAKDVCKGFTQKAKTKTKER